MDIASAAKHNHVPEQLLQRNLLDELKVLPEVSHVCNAICEADGFA
jgi:hypothetical protein